MIHRIFVCTFLILAGWGPTAGAEPGSLEDIRQKTGWKSPIHSQQYQQYIPLITPGELLASLDKYCKDVVRIKVLFHKITSRRLNNWYNSNGTRRRWSSKRYISFSAKDPQGQVSGSEIYYFVRKNSPAEQFLLKMSPGTPVIVTGRVKSKDKGKAWIEVEQME